jgi:hypothetical protein
MLHPSKNHAISAALQDPASTSPEIPATVPMAAWVSAELHRLKLSELLEEQLRILDEIKGTWVDEGIIVSAMDAVRTITGEQGYEPSQRQQERLRAHGYCAPAETPIPLSRVRRFARRLL